LISQVEVEVSLFFGSSKAKRRKKKKEEEKDVGWSP